MPPIAQAPGRSILVVATDKKVSDKVEVALSRLGHNIKSCANAVDALIYSARTKFDLILVDTSIQELSGVDLIEGIEVRGGKEEILVMAPFADTTPADKSAAPVAGLQVAEHLELEELVRIVDQALTRHSQRLRWEEGSRKGNRRARPAGKSDLAPTTPLMGCSPVMKQLVTTIERIAPIESNVLITGDTGTGKELVARAIHDCSARRNAPFVDLNCSAIPETLFEAEFFGHQRGTFTGAYETRGGLFERASGGTLFLDEVDTLNLAAQAKLLRVLQERQLRRVGGRENISVDVRIIAATNSNLKAAIKEGSFRPDLYFRLRVVPLHVPSLCERGEDIMLLVSHFLERHAERNGQRPKRFSEEARRALMSYSWPGNVRELENVIEYAMAIGDGEALGISDLPADMFENDLDDQDVLKKFVQSNVSLAEVERRYILSMFDRCGRHHIETAAKLSIDRRTLYRKLQQYGMEVQIRTA